MPKKKNPGNTKRSKNPKFYDIFVQDTQDYYDQMDSVDQMLNRNNNAQENY